MEPEQPHLHHHHHHPHLHIHPHCAYHHLLHFHCCRSTPHIHFHHHCPNLSPLPSFGFPHRPPPFPIRSISEEPIVSAVDHPTTMREGLSLQKQEFNEDLQLDDEDEEVEFVLTDEWREFFAKSEAKRRADKQRKQKARNRK
ncbi:uncharacterized histidine-rich protein DDB_G0274557-like [Dioscorea cayenensis subsp. rotundata]|uniref:Uncharacterized histidine-rich protein DDB_G0274557-like n=1 Tax=Dioscorea cayennensis subsp. rotundata TaxID=55577 RepID=A0AB40BH29_DIOCR|nr:uncharacterized histidine-rich protein DDB_G0274557-like [Dioscorea cayenensis subsp. rotundata]